MRKALKVLASYRLSVFALELVDVISHNDAVSKTSVVESAIRKYAAELLSAREIAKVRKLATEHEEELAIEHERIAEIEAMDADAKAEAVGNAAEDESTEVKIVA